MSTITFKPLHATFGAECHGVDFSQPVPDDAIKCIQTGMAKYGVLVFRATNLSDTSHVAFAGRDTPYDGRINFPRKERIQEHVLGHSFVYSRQIGAPDCAAFQGLKVEDHPVAFHPLQQLHEARRRMNLYIAAHAHHIQGSMREDSWAVLEALMEHATRERYTLTVEWENDGDLVIWDNTCVMHQACGGSFEGKHVRDMRRRPVHEGSSEAWGLDERGFSATKVNTKMVPKIYSNFPDIAVAAAA